MSNQRTSFAKRQREQNRKDKARAKQERLAVRRGQRVPTTPNSTSEAQGSVAGDDTQSSAPVAPATTSGDAPGA